MRSRFGNIVIGNDGLLYGKPRKQYTRTVPYPAHIIKIAPLKRERATIIKLRNLGYPINMISKFLGRSTSFVFRTVAAAQLRGSIKKLDMRKLVASTRLRCSSIRWRNLQKYWSLWVSFLLGEVDEPP